MLLLQKQFSSLGENQWNRLAQLGENAWFCSVTNRKSTPELFTICNPAKKLQRALQSRA
jgi:hypothetical protein